jgi:ferredoxin
MNLRLVFIYPSLEEVECFCEEGVYLSEAAESVGIAMDGAIPQTCQVRIESASKLTEPTSKELADFGTSSDRTRYANTYKVSEELNEARIFLNIIRVEYIDRNKVSHKLTAILNENLMSFRDRNSSVVDRAFSCRGSLACASCHVLDYSGDTASEDEVELLYTSPGFCDQSRLGCQISMTKNRDNQTVSHPRSNSG